jgi:hypothetical protein
VAQHAFKSFLLSINNDVKTALQEAEEETNHFWQLMSVMYANFTQGNTDKADVIMEDILLKYNHSASYIAFIYGFRKDNQNTFKWLNIALERKDINLLFIINHPVFRPMWMDSRWKNFIEKINLPNEHWLMHTDNVNIN